MREESNEIFIGTEEGVIKVRTIRRKGSKTERWDGSQIDKMRGTPGNLNQVVAIKKLGQK